MREAIKKLPGTQTIIDLNVRFEDWWFDLLHNTDTSTQRSEQVKRGWLNDPENLHYLPIRPKCARRVLKSMPPIDYREYTFIDLGSGKGRMLLMAQALPFKKVVGVELRNELYNQALTNLQKNRARLRYCQPECFNMDATSFEFPDEKLVVCLANPFGPAIMQQVLNNLGASLDRSLRDVVVAMNYPVCAFLVDRMPQLSLVTGGRGYRIYRTRMR